MSKRQSLGTPKGSVGGMLKTTTRSLQDDPVIIHKDSQLTEMQTLLGDHLRAVKEVSGQALTRAQRKVVFEKRTDFAASIFNQVSHVDIALWPSLRIFPESELVFELNHSCGSADSSGEQRGSTTTRFESRFLSLVLCLRLVRSLTRGLC